jgi:hypothetical protein
MMIGCLDDPICNIDHPFYDYQWWRIKRASKWSLAQGHQRRFYGDEHLVLRINSWLITDTSRTFLNENWAHVKLKFRENLDF